MAGCDGAFPVGHYDVTWNSVAVGLMEGPPRVQMTPSGFDIRASKWGQSVISSVYTGSNDFLIVVLKEWLDNAIAAMWPFPVPQSAAWPNHGLVGQLMSCRSAGDGVVGPARELKLTALTGTPAATYGPLTLTAPRACLAPQHTIDLAFGVSERLMALVFRLYPDEASDRLSTFTITSP